MLAANTLRGGGSDEFEFESTAAAGSSSAGGGGGGVAGDAVAPAARPGYGHFRGGGNGGHASLRPSHPSSSGSHITNAPLSSAASLVGTPEDRQRAVAKLLSRGESFSLEREEERDEYELTPDKDPADMRDSPLMHASEPIIAPPPMSFDKESVATSAQLALMLPRGRWRLAEMSSRVRPACATLRRDVAPIKVALSGLAGIHRPSLDGRPVIQTPQRYAIPDVPAHEYSDSGRAKASKYTCTVFLHTGDEPAGAGGDSDSDSPPEHVRLSLHVSSTAAQAVLAALTEYLRTHTHPARALLGQPATYRLYMAEEDGELDDSFPVLDPAVVLSTTGADCFLLQRRPVPKIPTGAAAAAGSARVVPRGDELASGDDAWGSGDRTSLAARHARTSSSGPVPPPIPAKRSRNSMLAMAAAAAGPSSASSSNAPSALLARTPMRQSHRTSSDADLDSEELAQARAEQEADEEEARRIELARANGAPPRGGGARGSKLPHGSPPAKRPSKSKSFSTLSLRACLSCACFAPAPEERETEPIGPS